MTPRLPDEHATSRSAAWLAVGMVWLVGGLTLAGCGGSSPVAPTPPPTLGLTCPANVVTGSVTGQPVEVSYPPPSPQGGTAPVAVTCTPASGALFPLGESVVTCTATDARGQTGSCTFTVRVQAQLQRTRIVAFGDSLTWGEGGPAAATTAWRPLVRVDRPYPSLLEEQLDQQYPFQAGDIVVLNEGVSGEVTSEGVKRLPGVLKADQAQVVLLLEGANDLNQTGDASVKKAAANLEEMVKAATQAGVTPYLATLPPQNPAGPKGQNASLVPTLNAEIAKIAAAKGAVLVDLYQAFGGDLTLISADGLHPNQTGYQRMADTFFLVIKRTLEVKPVVPASSPAAFPFGRRR